MNPWSVKTRSKLRKEGWILMNVDRARAFNRLREDLSQSRNDCDDLSTLRWELDEKVERLEAERDAWHDKYKAAIAEIVALEAHR